MPEYQGKGFNFNWHADDTSEFLKYIYISLIADSNFEEMMQQTDRGRAIWLRVFVNDQEVNARHLMEGLEANFDLSVQDAVKRRNQEIDLESLNDTIREIEKGISKEIRQRFEKIGITFGSDEDY